MSLDGMSVDQFPLGKVNADQERQLSAYLLNTFESLRSFWSPRHTFGQQIIDAIGGKFFTTEMKAEMTAQRKVPIEIAEGWPKFSAMVGISILSMKSGGILPQGEEDAPDAEFMQVVSKVIDNETGMKTLRAFAVRDAYATGCPQFIILDRPVRNLDGKTMAAYFPSWRSGFLDPLCRDFEKLSDCRNVGFQHLFSKADLLRRYPHRKAQIEEAFAGVSSLGDVQGTGLTAEERSTYFAAVETGRTEVETLGRIHLIELFSLVAQTRTLWVSPNSDQPEDLEGWDEQRVAQWRQANPEYQPIEMEVDVLWVSSVLMTGQVMENRPHWFQEGRYPLSCLVLQSHNDLPVTPLQYAMPNWKLQTIAKTEHIQSIRMATDGLTIVREGAIKNEEDLHWELTRPGGRVVAKRGFNPSDVLHRLPNQREQVAWADVYAEAQMTNDRLTVDRNLEGGAQSSQEAAKVVQLRVTQMQNKSAQAQMAVNAFARDIEDCKLKMLPKLVTEETAFRYIDESNGKGQPKKVVANQVVETDPLGDPIKVINRLDAAKYDVVEVETDDSPTGKEAELSSFVMIMQNILPSVPPEYWPVVLSQIPNSICQKIAREAKARAEAEAAAPQKPVTKVTATIPVDKLSFDPIAQKAAEYLGVLPQGLVPQAAAPTAAEQPAPQGEGAIA